MSEYPIIISNLNDFIFCPASIYFHGLDADTENITMQTPKQLNGTAAHEKTDAGEYSTSAYVLQGTVVYSEKYNLFGKIDTFHIKDGVLRERKKKVKIIYDGYRFQLYAQYFALKEMGYNVKKLVLYSMEDNKSYEISLPEHDEEAKEKFETLIERMQSFSLKGFRQENIEKCLNCIYEPLCSFSKSKTEELV
ncbi:MAG: type V CRISPR-associated protein Cas4 [Clostridia bacterium]|nr:type V CRISPR-associated protein Cas4 [Clostridia bacterium]